jgi:hypothetical protein
MNESDAVAVMGLVAALWPNYRSPGSEAEAITVAHEWVRMLGDFEHRAVEAGVRAYAAEGHEWPPAVGLLRQRLVSAREGSHAPDVAAALAEVDREIRRLGHLGAPRFSHPAVTATVDALGGWQSVCASTNAEAYRAHFLRLYPLLVRRHAPDATPPADRLALAQLRAGHHVDELEAGGGEE